MTIYRLNEVMDRYDQIESDLRALLRAISDSKYEVNKLIKEVDSVKYQNQILAYNQEIKLRRNNA